MLFIVGMVIVIGSVLGGYMPHGSLQALNQPLELLIILGAAVGAFVASNSAPILKRVLSHLGRVFKGSPYDKAAYLELLTMLYALFRLAKAKGMLSLEPHVDDPQSSDLFASYPGFLANHHAVEFLTDYLRLLTMGSDDPHEIDDLMTEEMETHHNEAHEAHGAITTMGEGLPAFGIVAAVLGVIVTMSSITEPPEVLGGLIGGALVGTFLGILMAYGMIMPLGKNMANYAAAEAKYFECVKAGLLAHLKGCAPAVSVEFARKTLYSHERPTFMELEEAFDSVPAVQK